MSIDDRTVFTSRREVNAFHVAALSLYRSQERMQSPDHPNLTYIAKFDPLLQMIQQSLQGGDDVMTLRLISYLIQTVMDEMLPGGEDDCAMSTHVELYTMLCAMKRHLIEHWACVEKRSKDRD